MSIESLIASLAALSAASAPVDSNKMRRGLEDQLSSLCAKESAELWLPSFFGSLDNGGVLATNQARLAGSAVECPDGILSLGYGSATNTPSVESFVAASFLSDLFKKQGKSIMAQNKGKPLGLFASQRLASMLFEVAAVSTVSGSSNFPKPLLNWVRKLSVVVALMLQNSTQELSIAVRCLVEFINYAMDMSVSDLSPMFTALPFVVTNRTVAALHTIGSDQAGIACLRGCLIAAAMTSLHVLTKTASEKALAQKALKSIQISFVGPALIAGEWVQELFFRSSAGVAPLTLLFNVLSLARVVVCKLSARSLKSVLSTSTFASATGPTMLFHSARGSTVGATALTGCGISNFMINGFGSMLSQFAGTDLPQMVALTTGQGAQGQIADPLAFRANYFILKTFNRILTDSYDGAVGSWTQIIPADVCASSIVSSIFSILMVLPSPRTCDAVAVPMTFPSASSCPDFDVAGQIEKLFFLCSGSIQHICSMDESAPYYASVLGNVFPTQPNAEQAMNLATSVIRRILVEYLRDDNSVKSGGAGGEFQQRLLQQWQSEPEKYFEELELLNDGDTSEGAAEQLFTSLTGCASCKIDVPGGDSKGLFPEAAWQVVNEMLQFNATSDSTAASDRELAKLMAYRAIGLGHYTLSAGQEDNYRSFFYNSLLPEMQSSAEVSPLVQRRAIWCVGMWCESATASMRQDFFKALSVLLTATGATLNPVILLTALKSLEHFVNDMYFDPSHLPEGFVPMLFGGLRSLFPVIKSPAVLQNVCGLVFVIVSKCGAMEGIGNVMIEMLTPAISQFTEEILKEADGEDDDGGGAWSGEWDDGDDATGDVVGAVRIVLETLTTAMYSSASDAVKWASPVTQPLLRLLKLLTDPFEVQGSSGHYQSMLEDEAWQLLGAMIRTTETEFLLASPALLPVLLQMASFALNSEMFERDFEGKSFYLRFIVALWLLCENYIGLGGGDQGILEFLNVSRSTLQNFASSTIAAAMSTADDELLLVSVEIGVVMTVLPSTTAVSAPIFMKVAGDYFFTHEDSELEANGSSPAILTLLSYTLPRCIPRGTPSPAGLADKINAISDVTSSNWSIARIMMLASACVQGHLDFSQCPTDSSTLSAVAETCASQLQALIDEEGDQSGLTSTFGYSGELIAEGLSDDSRRSPHTLRLQQLLSQL